MTAEIAVLAIHGIGSQEPDYAEEMFDEPQDRLTGMSKDAEKVARGSVYWADVLEKNSWPTSAPPNAEEILIF